MSYTEADLLAVRKAKVDLSTGNRIGQVTIMGQVIRYESTTIESMTTLETSIIKVLNKAKSQNRIRQVALKYDRGV